MLQNFFTNTIQSKFIKSLVYNTPLPYMQSVSEGDYIVAGETYAVSSYIIHCIKCGTYIADNQKFDIIYDTKYNKDIFVSNDKTVADYFIVDNFDFGQDIPEICEHYVSKYNYYDSETHKKLGKLLRYLRDVNGINLMPFYNCFNYSLLYNVTLDPSQPNGYISEENPKVKVFAIPIEFNKEYTIAMDCPTSVLLKSVIYDSLGMVREASGAIYTDGMKENNGSSFVKISSTKFNSPFYYSINNTLESAKNKLGTTNESVLVADVKKYQLMQNKLYLLIQVPRYNNSSITILEGHWHNFKDVRTRHLYDDHYLSYEQFMKQLPTMTYTQLNEQLISNLQLLTFNTGNIVAFSDKLIEYLLLNVITPYDTVAENIVKIQRYSGIKNVSRGIFNKKLRASIFFQYFGIETGELFINNKEEYSDIDVNGMIDKNIEKYITKGYDV